MSRQANWELCYVFKLRLELSYVFVLQKIYKKKQSPKKHNVSKKTLKLKKYSPQKSLNKKLRINLNLKEKMWLKVNVFL